MAPSKLTPDQIPHPIGDNVHRVDAREKVTGAAVFADDIQFGPGLLFARIKRSPHPHALIKKIDVSKARALPGVKAVVTGDDFTGYIGLYLHDRYIFCRDRVRYVGDPVAGVAAVSEEVAERALDLIEVEYEPLPGVFDPEYGASPEAPLLHPNLGHYEYVNFIFPEPGTNISNHFKLRKGDVTAAWGECAAIIERTYHIPHIQHVPIEPHIAVAKVDDDGKVSLWGSSQSPFAQRSLIAHSLGISPSDVQVIAPFVGGGFGCKAGVSMEALAVAIATKVRGRPVKLRLTREEEFFCAFVRQGVTTHFKMGCDRDGRLLAMENKYYWDGGAYTEYGVNITRAAGYSCTGPYNVPNVNADSYCVYTNHPVGGPMRGFGMPEIHAGLEQCIDELAEQVGVDRVAFRKLNCIKTNETVVTGMTMHATGLEQCITRAAEAIGWGKKEPSSGPNKRRGKGIAVMWKAPAMPPNAGSSAQVRLNEDGTVTVKVGGQEIGQGSFTVAAQMAAAALGVPYDWVRVTGPLDTDTSPYEWQTVASRLTWSMGNAVAAAARDARQQILENVAKAWDESVENLDIVDGNVISYKSEESMSLKNIVIYGIPKPNDQGWTGGPVVGRGNFMPTYVTGLDPETGQGPRAVVHYTTGAQAVEVEVDTDTGRVEVLRGVTVFDVGKAINPDMVRAQMEGGFVQGVSTALFEALQIKEGVVQNPSFVDYRIATSVDAPVEIEANIVEVAQDDGPWGARGIGEHPMVPTIPAIANAIYDAIGLRPGSPPFTSEKIYLLMNPDKG
ncbi:MAG: xanthine dehydrogenase family protein molybdopterin-binding subunit [Chloroflexota bacterium]|nr:MAG: xanthine dehydrogenase family protein molybdopterin-binding subunit [Chloroflexota bacterium]